MGKIRTRVLGNEEVEEKQKKIQKEKSAQKKLEKKSSKPTEALKEAEQKEKLEKAELSAKSRIGEEEEVESKPKASEGDVKAKSQEKKAKESVKVHVVGKKHKAALKKVDPKKEYLLDEAIATLKKLKYAAFDESVELHLNVDEQGLKGEVELPHSTGKVVRVKIADEALLENIDKGLIEFDVLVAHPSFMPKLAKYARVLGPKGLMPNPKTGTVSTTPEEVVKKFAKGTLRWKTEPKFPLIHQMIGKISFEDKQLIENARSFVESVNKAHVKAVFIKTTMSPSMKLNLEKV